MKLKRKHLRQIIVEQLSKHQSELSYAKSKYTPRRSRKGLQKSFWKAHRGPAARGEIFAQLGDVGVEDELPDTIGGLVPIGPSGWSQLDGIPGPNVPSEKDAYLADLAWDIADGRVTSDEISDDAIEKLISLAPHVFGDTLDHAYGEKRVQDDMADAAAGVEANLIHNLRRYSEKLDTDDLVPEEDLANYEAVYDALLQRGFSKIEIDDMVKKSV